VVILVRDRKLIGADPAGFEKSPDLRNFIRGQAVLGMAECRRMSAEIYANSSARSVVDLRAERFEDTRHIPEADIGADRMRENRMQNLAMMVIH